jgi:hypothetical protein
MLKLQEKILSKNTSHGVGITQMEKALVLQEYGMEVTRQKDPISFG